MQIISIELIKEIHRFLWFFRCAAGGDQITVHFLPVAIDLDELRKAASRGERVCE